MLDIETMSSAIETQADPEMQTCIQNCLACHSICLETVMHCLHQGGKHAEPAHIRLLMDCAEICQASANFMLRHSLFHIYTCDVCADICEACADDCEQFTDDTLMQKCAEICRRCAASCREMAEQSL
jgi:hypothetical protein